MPRSRIVVMVLALVALTIQLLAVQSHVHRPQAADHILGDSPSAHFAGTGNDHASRAPHHRYPDDQDPSKCPFCQQLGHSGQLLANSLVVLSFRCVVRVYSVAYNESARALGAVRHAWQSRAPPK
jgi:hypothetical protein